LPPIQIFIIFSRTKKKITRESTENINDLNPWCC